MRNLIAYLLLCSTALGAFPEDWAMKAPIVLQSSKIDSTLSNFTVLVTREMLATNGDDVVDPSGAAGDTSQTDGGDIRFSSDAAGSTQLPCDVISWEHDTSTSAEDAECLVAVMVASLSSSSNTTIYIWYGTSGTSSQPAADNAYGSDNAYDANWEGFWPDAGATDRTSNSLDLTASGSPTVGGATGPTGSTPATDFDGSTQWMEVTSGVPTAAPLTFIHWGETDSQSAGYTSVQLQDTSATNSYFLLNWAGDVANDPIRAWTRSSSSNQNSATAAGFSTGVWSHAAGSYDTASRFAYHNGVQGTEETTSITPTSIDSFSFGSARDTTPSYFDGAMALVQLHSTVRSAAWIKADYEQINDPAAFGVTGTPVANSSGTGALIFNQQAD